MRQPKVTSSTFHPYAGKWEIRFVRTFAYAFAAYRATASFDLLYNWAQQCTRMVLSAGAGTNESILFAYVCRWIYSPIIKMIASTWINTRFPINARNFIRFSQFSSFISLLAKILRTHCGTSDSSEFDSNVIWKLCVEIL